ncbi:MAG: PAS domain-containing protein, partial [Chloroflexales bacterium]|nr:PAS domain-containing protein [Chloroflexales bacterium]
MRVLIAEADLSTAHELAATVAALGHVVTSLVESAAEALTVAAHERPDLVLMDVHLAGAIDSLTAAQHLQTQLHIPVVSLTAHTAAELVQHAITSALTTTGHAQLDERTLWDTLDVVQQQQQHLQQQLEASEARLATTLHSLDDAVLMTDLSGTLTVVNAAAAHLCGFAPEDLVGCALATVAPLVQMETYTPLPDLVAQALAAGAPIRLPTPTLLLAPDGQSWPIEGRAAPLRDAGGQLTGIVLVIREIRARQAAEAAQHQAQEALRAANTQLAASLATLERQTAELRVLSDLGGALLQCPSLEEGYAIVTHAPQRLFPDVAGMLFVPRPGHNALEPILAWGVASHPVPPLPIVACRALGDGQIVLGEQRCGGCRCEVVPAVLSREALCVPLQVEGETLGVLHVHLPLSEPTELGRAARAQLALAFAEQAALGLANVRLRALLREQAIRDPLTGLFNRRYLEETLSRELHR